MASKRKDKKTGVQGAVLNWLEKNKDITLQHYYNSDTRTAIFIVIKYDNDLREYKIDCV